MKRKIVMKNLYTFCVILFLLKGFSANSAGNFSERVFVYTDKDSYVVGEDIWMKLSVVTPELKQSTLSKVGYIEISDTEKPHLQLKLVLKNGTGSGKIRISEDIPSGIYELSGYTRFMRNEGAQVVFKRKIAIVNPGQKPDRKKVKLDEDAALSAEVAHSQGNVRIKTDKNSYQGREKVKLSLENLSQGLSDVVVSVRRNDLLTSVEKPDNQDWLKQVKQVSSVISNEWIPEYEGHIVTGEFIGDVTLNVLSALSVVGGTINCVPGQISGNNKISSFYTDGVYGPQEVVTSVSNLSSEELPHQLTVVSPYANYTPESLPELLIRVDSGLLAERYLGAQLTNDIVLHQTVKSDYYTATHSYDLDEYTRFPTLSETIFEFVYMVKIGRIGGERKFRVFSRELDGFTTSSTLVLLDGVPVFDSEQLINYNPYLLKKIEVFDGRHAFGDRVYESVLLFTTHAKNLPNYQLGPGALLFKYDFPFLPIPFVSPDYQDESLRNSRLPDFRHTLYWNPEVKVETGKPVELSFYTSDLTGNFEVSIEGFDSEGKMVSGKSYFEVK